AVLAGDDGEVRVRRSTEDVGEPDDAPGAEVAVVDLEVRRRGRSEVVVGFQRSVRLYVEPYDAVAERFEAGRVRAVRRCRTVAGRDEQPAVAVGHDAAAAHPDAGLTVDGIVRRRRPDSRQRGRGAG